MRQKKAYYDALTPRVLELHESGKTVKEISEEVGASHVWVTKTLNEAGIETPRKERKRRLYYTDQDRRGMVKLEWESGKLPRQIAADLGIQPKTVRRWLVEAGVYDPTRDKNPLWAKTEPLLPELETLYRAGKKVSELALQFDLEYEYLYEVMRRKGMLDARPHRTIGPFEFIDAWQNAESAAEVAEHFGISVSRAQGRASYYRSRGVGLKNMMNSNSYDWDKLAEFAQQFMEDDES